jgi:CubicO group peptidase (beta-lactamase class C family)
MVRRGFGALMAGLVIATAAGPAQAEKPEIKPSDLHIPYKEPEAQLPNFTYDCGGGACGRDDFMRRAGICALLAMKGDRWLTYYNPDLYACPGEGGVPRANNAARLYGIASVTKSVTSTLLGFALQGDLAPLQRPISDFVPGLGASQSKGAYAGVPIERVLRMRSGAKFNEYGADGRRLRQVFDAGGTSSLDFLQNLRRAGWGGPQDGRFSYAGADTQAIGLLVEKLGRTSMLGYVWSRLWNPLGMESRAKWSADWRETPAAYCCLSATAPDLLRFGKFVMDRGRDMNGKQLLSSEWFDVATRTSDPESDRIPRDNVSHNEECPEDYPGLYRYQWWLFEDRTDFTGIGINGQFLHVYPDEDLVILQLAAWDHWSDERACESMAAHAAIAEMLRN